MQPKTKTQGTSALESVAAVGKTGDMIFSLQLPSLVDLLRQRHLNTELQGLPTLSPEDILCFSNGYVKLVPPFFSGEECCIATIHRVFWLFVQDDYNEVLILAYARLVTGRVSLHSSAPPHRDPRQNLSS